LRRFKFLSNPITGKIKLPETDHPARTIKTYINNKTTSQGNNFPDFGKLPTFKIKRGKKNPETKKYNGPGSIYS
jgi:hypothetical protein